MIRALGLRLESRISSQPRYAPPERPAWSLHPKADLLWNPMRSPECAAHRECPRPGIQVPSFPSIGPPSLPTDVQVFSGRQVWLEYLPDDAQQSREPLDTTPFRVPPAAATCGFRRERSLARAIAG